VSATESVATDHGHAVHRRIQDHEAELSNVIDAATAQRAALVVAVGVAVLVGVAVERRRGRHPFRRVRRRLLLGVPWGTLTAGGFVLAVYLFVQGGWSHWYNPVVVPFRAWSYLEPLGVATAAFGHVGPGHLIGNLVGTLTLAPLGEYAWGHYPEERGDHLFESLRTNPYARAFLLFPAGAVLAGVATALFAWGPVIGFSGVVFAFTGFALVYYPLGTVVALTASNVVRLGYRALREPVVVASGRPAFVTPWWADIAIQGHALGLLIGVVAAGLLAQHRQSHLPAPRRLLFGTLLVGVSQSLWAVYWFRGGGEFVLFRAAGLALVVLLALVVTGLTVGGGDDATEADDATGPDGAAVSDDADHDPVADRTTEVVGDGGGGSSEPRDEGSESEDDPEPRDESGRASLTVPNLPAPRAAAITSLLVVTAILAGVAIPTNLFTVSDEPLPGDPIEVRGYEVTYVEDVENGMVSVVDVEAFGLSTSVNTSGVVVRNPDRMVWTTAVTKGKLAFAGSQRVVVGGVGWRAVVRAAREGFSAAGGPSAYRVTLHHDDTSRVAFTSEPARADPKITGWNVSVAPNGSSFQLVVTKDDRTARAPIPGENETVHAAGLRFVREGKNVYALVGSDGNVTRVLVASEEVPRAKRN
jgi:membrane associated rhomboid family serine protease